MRTKTIIITILFITAISYLYVTKDKNSQINISNFQMQTKIKIAACPTCYELGKKLDSQKYELIPTSSTTESLNLLQNSQVDMVLSGRTLKPDEPHANYLIIKDGYSFLSNKPITLYEDELKNYPVFTDLNTEIIQMKFNIKEISQVDDVYQFLDKGIIITSWENTDYTKAETVHLLKKAGERVALTRRLTLYCSGACNNEAQEIVSLISNNQKGGDSL